MNDLNALAGAAVELFRQHLPWVSEKLAGAVASQAIKEAWEHLKRKLVSPGGQEAVQKVESHPDRDRNWDTLKNHLLDALEQDAAFREHLSGLVTSPPLQQSITEGDRNKQAAIIGSPGASIEQ